MAAPEFPADRAEGKTTAPKRPLIMRYAARSDVGRIRAKNDDSAYVGRHLDNRDTFPFDRVALGSYWLADARVAYAVRPGLELFARGSNLLDQKYQDVFSYRTEGRGLFAGIRLADRRSSP